jgi:23S rRNA (uracil1939-C5)-methyltransferase
MTWLGCELAGRCGGCPAHDLSVEDQLRRKCEALAALVPGLPAPTVAPVDPRGFREKADLQARDGVIGLFDLNGDGLVDLAACPMFSPALHDWVSALRRDPPPGFSRLSFRARVAPDGTRGVWLDGANAEIATLLQKASWLHRQATARVVVEIGQRHKEATLIDGVWKLREGPLRAWTSTRSASGQVIPLMGRVGGFSQPGGDATRRLVEAVVSAARAVTGFFSCV